MEQMARNAIDEDSGYLRQHRYLLHDRDTKFCVSFRNLLATGNVKCLALPPRSPKLKDYASHCTSCVAVDATSLARHRSDSFMPWALHGGLSPGCS
jgi:putative transposase